MITNKFGTFEPTFGNNPNYSRAQEQTDSRLVRINEALEVLKRVGETILDLEQEKRELEY